MYYYPAQESSSQEYKSVPYPETSLLLEDLQIDTNYEVRMTTYNSKGIGPFSRPLEFFVGEAGKTVMCDSNLAEVLGFL